MHYSFRTRGVCAQIIEFDMDENKKVSNVQFFGGCNGNLKAISKLVDGMTAENISSILAGNDCNGKGTSCADQLAIAVMEAASK